jgi:GT2 family glycosyltransferase
MKISIVIVNWNGASYLKTCLPSIFGQSFKECSVILVDNGSSDHSVDFVARAYPEVRIIRLKNNLGFVEGNNIGILNALEKDNPEYVLLLNNDTEIIGQDFIEKLVEAADHDRVTGIFGCQIVFPDGRPQHSGNIIRPFRRIYLKHARSSRPYEVDSIMGSFFLIRRSVMEKIGLLDRGFAPYLHEETDYCLRAKKAGFLVKVVPDIKIVHFWSQSMARVPSRYFSLVLCRNSIRLKLLNEPLFSIIPRLLMIFPATLFTKKKSDHSSLWNYRLKKDVPDNILIFLKAWFFNLKNLVEIMDKRYHRTKKI